MVAHNQQCRLELQYLYIMKVMNKLNTQLEKINKLHIQVDMQYTVFDIDSKRQVMQGSLQYKLIDTNINLIHKISMQNLLSDIIYILMNRHHMKFQIKMYQEGKFDNKRYLIISSLEYKLRKNMVDYFHMYCMGLHILYILYQLHKKADYMLHYIDFHPKNKLKYKMYNYSQPQSTINRGKHIENMQNLFEQYLQDNFEHIVKFQHNNNN